MLLLIPQNTIIILIAVVDQLNDNLALHFAVFFITLYAFLVDNLHSTNLSDSAFSSL